MRPFTLFFLAMLTWFPTAAEAGSSNLNPRVRVHAGAALSEGPAPVGYTAGIDARASRFIYMNLAAFFNPTNPLSGDLNREELRAPHLIRHGIYALPGIRIPHRQPKAFSWDITFRGGFGILWTSYAGDKTNSSYGSQPLDADVMTAAGVDLGIRRGAVGLRLAARTFFAWPHDHASHTDPFFWAPQVSVEGLYQF
jgi:hypothetical protein